MKYLFDNCISPRLPMMLRALGVDAEALRERFAEDISDIDLFTQIAGRPIVFVSTDTSQLTRERELRALRDAGLTCLHFGPFFPKKRLWDQAVWLLSRWPIIDGFARGVARATWAEIKQNGKARVQSI